jgi:hypothetical protein
MTKSYFIITTLLILFFVSCKNDADDIYTDKNNGEYIIMLDEKRNDFLFYWSTEDIIGITAFVSGRTELYMNSTNRRYKSTNNETFVPESNEDIIPRPLAGSFVDFIAYHPYRANIDTTYTISLDEQSNQKQLEVLYSNNAKNITSTGNVKLLFSHVLSKIVINTTYSSGNLENKDLYDMIIKINNVSDEGALILTDGRIEHSDKKHFIKMKTAADGSSSEATILPGPASDISFTIELTNGNVYSAYFHPDLHFLPGHIHTYNVTITQTGISLNPIEIENWVIEDSYPQEEIADEIRYKTGDFYPNPNNPKTAIGIVYWLKPGTDGREGKIVSYDSAMKNWGDSNNRNLGTSISTGIINWDIITKWDPSLNYFPAFKWCRDKGEGWYLPSRYELHILNELWSANQEYMNSNIELINGDSFTFDDVYLASSESRSWPNNNAEIYDFLNKGWGPILKSDAGRIRAVKEF